MKGWFHGCSLTITSALACRSWNGIDFGWWSCGVCLFLGMDRRKLWLFCAGFDIDISIGVHTSDFWELGTEWTISELEFCLGDKPGCQMGFQNTIFPKIGWLNPNVSQCWFHTRTQIAPGPRTVLQTISRNFPEIVPTDKFVSSPEMNPTDLTVTQKLQAKLFTKFM